jgi:hypothetical protein
VAAVSYGVVEYLCTSRPGQEDDHGPGERDAEDGGDPEPDAGAGTGGDAGPDRGDRRPDSTPAVAPRPTG